MSVAWSRSMIMMIRMIMMMIVVIMAIILMIMCIVLMLVMMFLSEEVLRESGQWVMRGKIWAIL